MRAHPKTVQHAKAVLLAVLLLTMSVAATKAHSPDSPSVRVEKLAGSETGGSVLDLGAPGAFDAVWATCPNVLHDGKRFLMWYSSFYDSHMGRGGIGLATSPDGIHWTRADHGEAVLTVGPKGAFDDGQVMGPFVLRENGVYRMWYTGMRTEWHSSGIGFYRIGLAISKDGVHWKRANNGRSVLDVGPTGANDEVQAATPSILVEGGRYRMWYAAWAPKPGHTIATATSSDGVHWKREEEGRPVTGLLEGGQYGPAVTLVGSKFLMIYIRAGGKDARGLFAATSNDGRAWTPVGTAAVIGPGDPPSFDSSLAGHACFLRHGGRLMAWYTGYRKEEGGPYGWKLRIGAAAVTMED